MARLRLLFALFLLGLGTWLGALAISGYYEPPMSPKLTPAKPTAAPSAVSASAGASQFVGLASRQRFVTVDDRATAAPAKPKPAAKAKPAAAERRPQQAATQLPWPLNVFGN
jgi:hypothetical protein